MDFEATPGSAEGLVAAPVVRRGQDAAAGPASASTAILSNLSKLQTKPPKLQHAKFVILKNDLSASFISSYLEFFSP